MFLDYYAVLEIQPPVSNEQLKTAYHKQCLKWHPDTNPGKDTTERIREVIEAYIYLKDAEARELYDRTYQDFKRQPPPQPKERASDFEESHHQRSEFESAHFDPTDDVLKKWMSNAREQSKKILSDVIDEFKGATTKAGKSISYYFLTLILPMLIGFLFFKSCKA